MRAVRVHELGKPYKGEIAETPAPEPGPGDVVIRVHAAPVNYVDTITLAGGYQFTPKLPYTPGKGPVGVVTEVGKDVSGFETGERILAMTEHGGYAEMALAGSGNCYKLPDGLSFTDAATLPVAFDTAWMCLREQARIKSGESVLVLGANGAVGRAAMQLAKAMGAGRVLAGVSSPEKYQGLEDDGAGGMVDLSGSNLRDAVRQQVYDLNEGEGVDIVIDPIGGDAFDGAVRAIAWRGRLVVVGFAAGRIPEIKTNYLMLKNIEISGIQISDYRRREPGLLGKCYKEIFGYHAAGKIKAPASTSLPLEEWKSALEMVAGRRAPNRLILTP
ncbi:MAG: NADPH:quinone oxidoreductase family protein [Rhodospirillales bacterium]|jgi:NADPH2:quinone reductase|nr:NADPH:quinone oxidoreductase family protein [Rhodospirillales bacterium]